MSPKAKCKHCGVPFTSHPGLQLTCKESSTLRYLLTTLSEDVTELVATIDEVYPSVDTDKTIHILQLVKETLGKSHE